jgi:hypothetical protein
VRERVVRVVFSAEIPRQPVKPHEREHRIGSRSRLFRDLSLGLDEGSRPEAGSTSGEELVVQIGE